jgi:hypothetical protein
MRKIAKLQQKNPIQYQTISMMLNNIIPDGSE